MNRHCDSKGSTYEVYSKQQQDTNRLLNVKSPKMFQSIQTAHTHLKVNKRIRDKTKTA